MKKETKNVVKTFFVNFIMFSFLKARCDTKHENFLKFLLLLTQIYYDWKSQKLSFDFTTLISSINDSLLKLEKSIDNITQK